MSDDKQTPVPCPFCGEEWGQYSRCWHHTGDCLLSEDDFFLRPQEVNAYNAACAKMRERVIESIEPRICMASAVCPNCQAGIEMVSLPSTLAKDGAK